MTDIALTAAQVSPVNETEFEKWTLIAGAAITRGQAVAVDAAGLAVVADGSTGAANNVVGIALEGAGAGQALDVMVNGSLYGFTIAALDAYTPLYLSNTAGALADAAGDVSKLVARVKPMHDHAATPTKVLYVNIPAAL